MGVPVQLVTYPASASGFTPPNANTLSRFDRFASIVFRSLQRGVDERRHGVMGGDAGVSYPKYKNVGVCLTQKRSRHSSRDLRPLGELLRRY
jgi:hypothetical protein